MSPKLRNAALLLLGQVIVRGQALFRDPYAQVATISPDKDPYPLYESVRTRGDMVRTRFGGYVTTSRRICDAVLRDPRFETASAADFTPVNTKGRARNGGTLHNPVEESFLVLNPPDHTRLRRLVQPFFTPRALKDRQPMIDQIVDDHLDRLDGEFDLVSDFAVRVPIQVIIDLLGVPKTDEHVLAKWGSAIVATLDGIRTMKQMRELHRALAEAEDFMDDLIARRRREPGDDIVSHLVATGDLTRADLLLTIELLLFAGYETTVNLIGNGFLAVLANPETRQPLMEDRSYAESFVEEVLRLDPPVQYTARFARERVEIGGVTVQPGMIIMMLLAGANRDPEVFTDPQRFDPARPNAREHLAFSAGIHYCVGAGLARMEAASALHGLFRRFPDLRVSGPMKRRPTRLLRGAIRLPVSGTPTKRSLVVKNP